MEQPEDSPKRRSTFYVSLENEPRGHHYHHHQSSSSSSSSSASKFQKSVSCDSEKYACSTFPITQSKTAPNVPMLTRTQSTNNDSGYQGKRLEPRGKVQSLTRIFESPKNNNNNNNNNNVESEQRKKVERTRSFKTIERFQNRFVGKKDSNNTSNSSSSNRKDTRLNKTIGSFDSDKNNVDKEERRRSKREDSIERRTGPVKALPVSTKSSRATRNDHAKSVVEPNRSAKSTSQTTSGPTLANLLIRRTHSTKLARSTSTLVRSSRHASIDSCNVATHLQQAKNDDADSGQENEDSPVLDESSSAGRNGEETDTDAGVHSGEWEFIWRFPE